MTRHKMYLPESVREPDPQAVGMVLSVDTSDRQPSTLASDDHEAPHR